MIREVPRTAEFRRILSLPRRDWRRNADLADGLTEFLRLPSGTMRLRAEQAIALAELHDAGGLFFQGEVGIGKTLVSLLAGELLDADRYMVIVPGGLRGKTVDEFRDYQKHWRARSPRVESSHILARDGGQRILDTFFRPAVRPLLVVDEVEELGPSVAAKIDRLLAAQPEIVVAVMSGTLVKRSIKDFWRFLRWCVRNPPLPLQPSDVYEWSCAIDEKVPEPARIDPGVLLELPGARAAEGDPLSRARQGVGERIFSTPGCIGLSGPALTTKLEIECVHVPLTIAEDETFRKLREDRETPDGQPISTALEYYRHATTLACGYWGEWEPRAPREWLDRRRDWARACFDFLAYTRRPLDTEGQVVIEIENEGGRHKLDRVYRAWKAVQPTFEPNPVPRWVGETALRYAAEWAKNNEGIIWTQHRPFAEKLEELTGIPYFGQKGLDKRGRYIEHVKGTVIASIQANHKGRNLQYNWHRALVTSSKTQGRLWEQKLGRLDRTGQTRDVKFDVVLSCREQAAAVEQARRDANFHADLLTSRPRLRYAQIHEPILPTVGWAWST